MPESATALQPASAAEPPLLEIHGIRKGFPGVVALDNVGFKLRAGTVHARAGRGLDRPLPMAPWPAGRPFSPPRHAPAW